MGAGEAPPNLLSVQIITFAWRRSFTAWDVAAVVCGIQMSGVGAGDLAGLLLISAHALRGCANALGADTILFRELTS
jgi:hypothetical protein